MHTHTRQTQAGYCKDEWRSRTSCLGHDKNEDRISDKETGEDCGVCLGKLERFLVGRKADTKGTLKKKCLHKSVER